MSKGGVGRDAIPSHKTVSQNNLRLKKPTKTNETTQKLVREVRL